MPGDRLSKAVLDLELVDKVVSGLLASLLKSLPSFSIPLRYVLSVMSED